MSVPGCSLPVMSPVPARQAHVYVNEPGVWSSSLVQLYRRCPRAWWITQCSGLTGHASAPEHWRRGTVAHAGMQGAYEACRDDADAALSRGRTRMVTFYDAADEALCAAWEAERMPDDPVARDVLREQVRTVLTTLRIPRAGNILGVEREVRAEMDGVPIRSYMDLVLRTGPDAVHVRDWKTFSALPTVGELRRQVQLPLYGWMARNEWPWARHVSVSIYSIPANAEVAVELTGPDLSLVEHAVLDTVGASEEDELFLPQPSEWCDSCAARSVCPVWNPGVAVGPRVDEAVLSDMRDALAGLEGF